MVKSTSVITATPSPLLRERTLSVLAACATAAASVEGAIVEFGVGAGETAGHLAELAVQFDKQLILVDHFVPLPDHAWRSIDGIFALRWMSEYSVPMGQVMTSVEREGLDLSVRAGLVKDVRFEPDEHICFAHVDVDLYTSTACAVNRVQQQMAPGGVMIVDDYGDPDWPGVQAAVDEYLVQSEWYAYRVEGFHQLVAIRL